MFVLVEPYTITLSFFSPPFTLSNHKCSHNLGAISQFETEIRVKRQMDGIVKAKNYGVKFGKKKSLSKGDHG